MSDETRPVRVTLKSSSARKSFGFRAALSERMHNQESADSDLSCSREGDNSQELSLKTVMRNTEHLMECMMQ